MKKGIAFFDFDGTITTKDTFLEFIKFCKGGLRFYFGFLWNSPYLIAYKIKLISNQTAKEKVLQFFFKKMPVEEFEKKCQLFSKQALPHLIRPKALDEIRKLKSQHYSIVIVSASPENWIQQWANMMEVELLATRLEIREGLVTGKLLGKNCHGNEKVRRIMEKYTTAEFDEIYVYGDSGGDKPMLKLATHPFYKPFC